MPKEKIIQTPEKWLPIFGCNGYEISTFGNVRSYRIKRSGEISLFYKNLKKSYSTSNKKKYEKAILRVDGKTKSLYIHRLVAQAFIINKDFKPQVNHIDNNPFNNHVDNLEWCTNSENINHRYKLSGTSNSLGQYIHKNRNTFRVYKKGIIDKCFKTHIEAKELAQKFY